MATTAPTSGSSATASISYADLYARWEKGNWRATEIDFSQDRVDWHELADGDQITIGRFDLHYICLTGPTVSERRDAAHTGVG